MTKRLKAIAVGQLFGCECYVLDGGMRVLSKRGLVRLLSSGTEHGRLEARLAALPSRYEHLAAGRNIEFVLPGGRIAHAVDAASVIAICSAYVEAALAGELRASQRHLARGAQRVVMASAEVGLTALIDEATGYDAIRQRGDLARLFRDSLGQWEEVFSALLVARLCALGCAGAKNVAWRGGRYPRPLASTFRRIYDLVIGEAAAAEMKARNPRPRHGRNHHQWLTDEARELLKRNMAIIAFAAQQSHSRDEFFARLSDHYTGQSRLVYAS